MKTQKSDLEKWVSEFSGKHCLECADNCCDGTRQLINIDLPALELFKEAGIPVYLIKDLNRDSVIAWLVEGVKRGITERTGSHFIGDVCFKDGSVVKKPAVILTPRLGQCSLNGIEFREGYTFVLYVEKHCPFYTGESGCKVYGNPNRPKACQSYPLNIHESSDNLRVVFHKWCLSSSEGVVEIGRRFPDVEAERL